LSTIIFEKLDTISTSCKFLFFLFHKKNSYLC